MRISIHNDVDVFTTNPNEDYFYESYFYADKVVQIQLEGYPDIISALNASLTSRDGL